MTPGMPSALGTRGNHDVIRFRGTDDTTALIRLLPLFLAAVMSTLVVVHVGHVASAPTSTAIFDYDGSPLSYGQIDERTESSIHGAKLGAIRGYDRASNRSRADSTQLPSSIAAKAARIAGGAPMRPTDLLRTESLRGNASSRKVREIAESMRQHGWRGDPVEVFFHHGEPYLVNGHHRVAAAMRAGIDDIPYRALSQEELRRYGYRSPDDLISDYANRGPDRLR